jgi:hypothetical protein
MAEFEALVRKFSDACGGLPLSLTVIGALLRGRNDLTHWNDELVKISNILPEDIQSRLKISYDSLDKKDKQIFLDTACFFIGEDKDTAIRIWGGEDKDTAIVREGLLNLENKCLIEVDSKNHIIMHDHLRDLGRDIAENESPYRLWRLTDNFLDDLPEKLNVRGINMVETSIENRAELDNRFLGMRGLKLLRAEGDCLEKNIFKSGRSQALIWLRWDRCPHSCLPPWILRVLQVCRATILQTLWGDLNLQLLSDSAVTWLRWDRCPYSSLPPWIPLGNVRVLEVLGGELETLWQRETQVHISSRFFKERSFLEW